MSNQITTAFVQQFSSNVFHLSQQRGSKMRPYVRREQQSANQDFYDRIGSVDAVVKSGRHSDTPQLDTPHSRRAVSLSDFEWADLIDKQDQIRILISPESAYAQAAAWAMGRSMDRVLIDAALGNAYSGQAGATSVPLAAAQFVGAVDGGALSGMNVETLRAVKQKFDDADVDDAIQRHIMVTPTDLRNMLKQTEVTNSDYAEVKALVQGNLNEFMGFQFHRTTLLRTAGYGGFVATISTDDGSVVLSTGNGNNARRCFAWAEDGLLLATGMDIMGRITERADKSYSTQVYASMSIGATRMEEAKVVGILCT